MRQQLIEHATVLLANGGGDELSKLGKEMTDQEKRYAIGVIEDMRDDALNAVMGWSDKWVGARWRRKGRLVAKG